MKHLTASTSPSPFSGENWFDPLEDAIRFRVRAFIEAVVAEEAQAALGGRARYQRSGAPKGYRNGHRHRQLVGTFGALTVSLPRVRLLDGDGGEKEWRSQTIQAYKRLTKRAEAIIANTYLAGTNTRRVRRALAGLFGGKVGKDAVSRAWRKVKTDWESWQARDLSGEDIVRLILDGTGVKAVPPIYSIYGRNLGILHHHRIPFPACIRSSKSSRTARRSTQKSLPCDSR